MDLASRIRRLGFRRWYERELIKGHAALVTCFLCALTVASLLEATSFTDFDAGRVSMLAVVFVATLLGWASWRRYISILQRAERYGERSSCPGCKSYARFAVVAAGDGAAQAANGAAADPWLRVQCRKCGTAWRMPE